ncbi:MAG: Dam family site-specific DNA-(adenine-N6)-methyltransferase [Rikenellaceae bacterium]|nr:Dam family site-specific DNA-(adenine-N6)-methyltransferase [Rikenellaceae bacterium]
MSKDVQMITKPFLRWAGGKTKLLNEIAKFIPNEFNNYHEPFVGGGALFFYLKSSKQIKNKVFLSDSNSELINTYIQIKQNAQQVIDKLQTIKNKKEDYYEIRNKSCQDLTDKAVQFIYLNKTSFNGLYRVNLKGQYNVPYGYRNIKNLYDFNNIFKAQEDLKNVELLDVDFYDTIQNVKSHDLIFLDPPYTVMHENNGFIKYNQKIFQWDDQLRLHDYIKELVKKDAYFILTNAKHKSILNLYSDIASPIEVGRKNLIGGKLAKRETVNEYIFTNNTKRKLF